MDPDAALTEALAEIEASSKSAETQEARNAWRHAGLVVRNLETGRALWHLKQHASFTSIPQKADAYRAAADLVAAKTGKMAMPPFRGRTELFALT